MGGGPAAFQNLIIQINMSIGASILLKVPSTTMILMLVLCLYSVLEGIAVGVADNETDAWIYLWTVPLHQIMTAIANAIALLKLLPHRPFLATLVYLSVFLVSTPIGVAIGVRIDSTTQGKIEDWIVLITSGSIAGIFVYECFKPPQKPCYLGAFASILLCVGVAAVASIWDSY
ncbi:hypothetical protein C5167_030030 [Papaver somniferum]|uniref:zinc transporter 2-like n=1 Tax=Papaver somniferum TaxID=3469 RepID=UPI000E6F809C|nr:zinc transporter 2-like [Papaver somniferum]RZC86679.1 hypothetical protein C5167_030030 [Papaver somniferum]